MKPMRNRFPPILAALLAAGLWPAAHAGDETGVQLRSGDGLDLVQARCAACHSLDYIPMNSTFLKRAGWEAEVRKMIRVMGAPVTDQEATRIVDYLVANYGAPG